MGRARKQKVRLRFTGLPIYATPCDTRGQINALGLWEIRKSVINPHSPTGSTKTGTTTQLIPPMHRTKRKRQTNRTTQRHSQRKVNAEPSAWNPLQGFSENVLVRRQRHALQSGLVHKEYAETLRLHARQRRVRNRHRWRAASAARQNAFCALRLHGNDVGRNLNASVVLRSRPDVGMNLVPRAAYGWKWQHFW